MTKCDKLAEDTVQSLILESLGPLIDLAYQPKKPIKVSANQSINLLTP